MTPDLANPLWQLLVIAGLIWLVLGLSEWRSRRRRRALAIERPAGRDDGRPDDEPQEDQAGDTAEGEPKNSETLSGRVVNIHAGIISSRRHPLTDPELLAVARHFDRTRLPDAEPLDLDLYSARDKLASDALDVLHGDRIHRRG